jgi:hypothetical protein
MAIWRGGDGYNVSLDDGRGVWHDFPTGEGGGVLDLVVRIRGGSRQDALRWVADFIGCPLDNSCPPAFDRARWARQQRQIEIELPNALLWRRAALALGEWVLERLKDTLWDQKLPQPPIGEIARWTFLVAAWRRLDDVALVTEYLYWAQHEPQWTAGLVHAARIREEAVRRAVQKYLTLMATAEEVATV